MPTVRRGAVWFERLFRRTSARLAPLSIGLVALMALSSCGGGQTRGHPLDSSWSDEDGAELRIFESKWAARRAPRLANVAIGIVDDRTIVGRALGGGADWRHMGRFEGRPVLTGTVVIGMGGGGLFALNAETGEVLWRRKALGRLRGAGDDGNTTIVSIESLTGTRSIVLAIDRDGEVLRQLYLEAVVGSPAVFDAFAFLPWNANTVVIFDVVDGAESARVVSSFPTSHAFAVGNELYFGERAAVRFDDAIVEARRDGGNRVGIPKRVFPDDPRWRVPGSVALPTVATRHDAVRYLVRPRNGAIDHYALSYFRLVIGLDANDGATRWVHHGDAPYIGGWAGTSSYALCDAAGNVVWLDAASGATLHRERLAESVRSCVIQSEAPPKRAETRTRSLAAQLSTALSIDDALSSPLQVELLDDLDQLDDADDATTALIALARDDDEHPDAPSTNVRQHAAELLARRTRGLDAMLHALHHDDDTTLPLAAIASALRRNLHAAAAPLLAARLNELGWRAKAIRAVADALEALAGTAERRALVVFLARVGCDPLHGDPALTVARTLGRLGGAASVRKVADSCEDGEIAAKLRAAVAASLYGPPR